MHGYCMLQTSMLLLLFRRGGAKLYQKGLSIQYTASLIAGHDND